MTPSSQPQTPRKGDEAGRTSLESHRGLWLTLMENSATICLKLANLEQAEGPHPVFPIPGPKGVADVSCLACDADCSKVCRVSCARFHGH